jgi:hypothetical protein
MSELIVASGGAAADVAEPERTGLSVPMDATVSSLRLGAGFLAFYGPIWMLQAALAGRASWSVPAVVVASLLGCAVMAGVMRQSRLAHAHPDVYVGSRQAHYLNSVTAAQLLVSVVGPVVLGIAGYGWLGFPFIAVTVGAFFLALAPILATPYHVPAGVGLCALAVVAAIAVSGSDGTLLTGLIGSPVLLAVAAANLCRAARLHEQGLQARGLR